MTKKMNIWTHYPTQDLVARLQAARATGVVLKYSDGATTTDNTGYDYQKTFRSLAPEVKAAGLEVAAWHYIYADTDATALATVVKESLDDGAEFVVLDAESDEVAARNFEAEGGDIKADAIMQAIRKLCPGASIGFTSFPIGTSHMSFPYRTFSKYCDFFVPQDYWGDIGESVDTVYNAPYFTLVANGRVTCQIQPMGQVANVTLQDMSRFSFLCSNGGNHTIHWWCEEQLTADTEHLLAGSEFAMTTNTVTGAQQPQGTTNPDIKSALAHLLAAIAFLDPTSAQAQEVAAAMKAASQVLTTGVAPQTQTEGK